MFCSCCILLLITFNLTVNNNSLCKLTKLTKYWDLNYSYPSLAWTSKRNHLTAMFSLLSISYVEKTQRQLTGNPSCIPTTREPLFHWWHWLVLHESRSRLATKFHRYRNDTHVLPKLKLQLSSALRDPLIRLLFTAETLDGSVTVSNGGGSYQVMLSPSERSTLIKRALLSWRCHLK